MIKFFDYIYYRVTESYFQMSKGDVTNYMMGSIVLTIIQMIHALTLFLLLSFFWKDNLIVLFQKSNYDRNKLILFVFVAILFAYNIYRYSRVKIFEKLKTKYEFESIDLRRSKARIICFYIGISLFAFIYTLIILVHSLPMHKNV